MKIYVNTNKFPATLNASTAAKTDASGILKVYTSTLSGAISTLALKRGTSIPVSVIFPSDTECAPSAVRIGIKPSGQFDGVHAIAAESSEAVSLEDGSTRFDMRLIVAADVIDKALGVGDADDISAADFHAEIEWTDADGNIFASETVPVEIQNNIVRSSSTVSGTGIPGDWTAIMLVEISWQEYLALDSFPEGVHYIIPDAPSEIDEHNEDADAHAGLFSAVRAEIPDASVVAENAAAVERIQESFTPLLETVPPNGDDNHAAVFGYVGTLRNLGAFGGSVPVRRLSVWTRSTSGTLANSAVYIWARILKAVDGAWVIAAQSENSLRFQDIGHNAEATWTMKPVPGVTPPSADETVAIVFVNAEDAAAGTSNGGFSLRVQSGLAGGRTGALPADPANVAVATWSPKIKLRFAALAGTKPAATQEALDALAGTVEAQGLSIDQAVEDLTEHADAIAALQSTIAEQNVKIAVLEAKTGIRKAYAYMTQTHFEATGGEATLYAYNAADSMSNATTEADWITGYTLNEVGDYTNTITVAANESATAREATFEVSLGSEKFSFTITQAGA